MQELRQEIRDLSDKVTELTGKLSDLSTKLSNSERELQQELSIIKSTLLECVAVLRKKGFNDQV